MNKKLLDAENDLLTLLKIGFQGKPAYASFAPEEIFHIFKGKHAEAELRAAFWTLRARGLIEHNKGKLVLRK